MTELQDLRRRKAKDVFHDPTWSCASRRARGGPAAQQRRGRGGPHRPGTLHGHDGVRQSAALLYQAIRNAKRYEYWAAACDDRMALLEWTADGDTSSIRDGVDSYVSMACCVRPGSAASRPPAGRPRARANHIVRAVRVE